MRNDGQMNGNLMRPIASLEAPADGSGFRSRGGDDDQAKRRGGKERCELAHAEPRVERCLALSGEVVGRATEVDSNKFQRSVFGIEAMGSGSERPGQPRITLQQFVRPETLVNAAAESRKCEDGKLGGKRLGAEWKRQMHRSAEQARCAPGENEIGRRMHKDVPLKETGIVKTAQDLGRGVG